MSATTLSYQMSGVGQQEAQLITMVGIVRLVGWGETVPVALKTDNKYLLNKESV